MIDITITPQSKNELFIEIQNKIEGIKELNSVQTKKQLMDVAFSLTALKFVKRTNMLARSNKKAFHHVYEWGGTGKESDRLFRIIKKSMSGGNASVYYKFNNSKKNSPVARVLTIPGKTGKRVTTTGIFKNKANVMESGKPVSFVTSKTIAIPSGSGISFIPPGKTINIKNPGGMETTGSFDRHFKTWWSANFPRALEERGVINTLEKSIARTLSVKGRGRSSVISTIRTTLGRYKTIGSVI